MDSVLSTTVIAVAVIVAATVSVCMHVIGSTDFVTLVGAFAGATGILHLVPAVKNTAGSGS